MHYSVLVCQVKLFTGTWLNYLLPMIDIFNCEHTSMHLNRRRKVLRIFQQKFIENARCRKPVQWVKGRAVSLNPADKTAARSRLISECMRPKEMSIMITLVTSWAISWNILSVIFTNKMLKATEIHTPDWLRANLSVKTPDKIFHETVPRCTV